MSRSKTSRSDFDQSAVGIVMSSAPPNGSSAPPSPPKPPNRSNCPSASLRLRLIAMSTALACTVTRPCRECPSESNAPALHSDSMTFLLQATASILRRKSAKSLNAPCSSRARAIASTRSEEHTSELQSPCNLVCRLLLEKKKEAQSDEL